MAKITRHYWISTNQQQPNSLQYHHKKMMVEKIEPDTFEPPCHRLRKDIETKLEEMLRE